MAVFLSKIFC